MIIDIDDSLKPHERQNLLEVLPLIYALEKFNGNKTQASAWLGISKKNLQTKVLAYEELKKYYIPPKVTRSYTK